jgi:hypothetical protein
MRAATLDGVLGNVLFPSPADVLSPHMQIRADLMPAWAFPRAALNLRSRTALIDASGASTPAVKNLFPPVMGLLFVVTASLVTNG